MPSGRFWCTYKQAVGIVTLIVLGRKGPHWIPFQAAALALSHTLNASFRNRLNVNLLRKCRWT